MSSPFRLTLLPESPLVFSSRQQHMDPRHGLAAFGPFGLREPGRHANEITVGIVGTGTTISGTRSWLERCSGAVASEDANQDLHPPFPGLGRVLHTQWSMASRWIRQIPEREIDELMRSVGRARFDRAVNLFAEAVAFLAAMDPPPRLILCALPTEIIKHCRSVGGEGSHDGPRLTKVERGLVTREKKDNSRGQGSWNRVFYPEVFETGDELMYRDFRRALKSRTMSGRVPIQLVQPHTWDDELKAQAPAIRAWNFCTAAYYKTGGVPWTVVGLEPGTCYIGIDFFRRITAASHSLHASLAQVFDERGEGHVLRGGEFEWHPTREHRQPSLPREEADALLRQALAMHAEQTGQPAQRVVVHKRARFTMEEVEGCMAAILDSGARYSDFLACLRTDFQLFREGIYPPLRGTFATVDASHAYLYTVGFVPTLGTYDGPHVPRALELHRMRGDSPIERLAQEVLALSRVDWNTTDFAVGMPITLNFADRVGEILTEFPADRTPESAYRFYM